MNNSRVFWSHRFLFVVLALFLIVIIVIGTAFSLTRDQYPVLSSQTTGSNTPFTSLTATSTNAEFINGQAANSDLTSTESPPAQTILPIEMPTLPAILDINSGLITHADRSEYKIALTFDVCQREGDLSGFDTEIVRVLNETKTPATFFLGGEWMRDHQQETLELGKNPFFELGNHSWSHQDLSTISPDEIRNEILLTQKMMFELLGYQTNLFRLPYGTYNEETLKIINGNGLYVIQWDIVSGDPDQSIDAARMTNGVLQQLQPGSIVIMHANGRGWHTAEALPAIIQSIRQQGYALVTISDLLNLQP